MCLDIWSKYEWFTEGKKGLERQRFNERRQSRRNLGIDSCGVQGMSLGTWGKEIMFIIEKLRQKYE